MSTGTVTVTYTVRGTGSFPIDMLRYDMAWPARETDAATIERLTQPGKKHLREFEVHVTGCREPTVERWESFGCKVEIA